MIFADCTPPCTVVIQPNCTSPPVQLGQPTPDCTGGCTVRRSRKKNSEKNPTQSVLQFDYTPLIRPLFHLIFFSRSADCTPPLHSWACYRFRCILAIRCNFDLCLRPGPYPASDLFVSSARAALLKILRTAWRPENAHFIVETIVDNGGGPFLCLSKVKSGTFLW